MAVLFWGISYVWTTMAFEYYKPITVMLIRLVIATLLMYIIFRARNLGEKVHRSDYKDFVILSFFSPFCFFIGENFGLLHTSPTIAAVIIATIPVFTPILGYVAFRERLSLINILGFLVSFAGVMIMVLDFEFRFSASPLGVFFLFFGVISALINIVFLKKLTLKYSSFTIIGVQNFLGIWFFLPVFLIMDYSHFITVRPSLQVVAALVALAVFGSTLAFMFYTTAVRSIGIARTAIFANMIPVVTAITSFLILGEALDLSKIIGMVVVICGLLMTQISRLRNRKKKQAAEYPVPGQKKE